MSETNRIVEVLGGKKVLGKKINTRDDLIKIVRSGLPYTALQYVIKVIGITRDEIVACLALSPRTLARRSKESRLQPAESDRVLRLARIVARANEVFGEEKSKRWLHKPNRALGQLTPLSLLDTDMGTAQVNDILTRIEHGVYS